MKTFKQKIIEYRNQINLNERFENTFPIDAEILLTIDLKILNKIDNGFERTKKLKELIKLRAKGNYKNISLNYWIINNWGGIKSFKRNEKNTFKIGTFEKQLHKKKLTKDTFGTISSLSKIASFIDPDNFSIYDSKVIYALNWLILTTENKLNFFPMPIGRNKTLVDFDLSTIIHLIHLKKYEKEEQIFINYQDAYFEYCDLLKNLSKEIYGQDSKPYELELLLFTISDKEIFDELKLKTRLKIYGEKKTENSRDLYKTQPRF
jgi:hypothetical protein